MVTDKYWGWWPTDVSASVLLPGDASAHIKDIWMLMGPEGRTNAASSETATISKGLVYFSAPRALYQNEGLVISLAWPSGYLKKPPFSSVVGQLAAAPTLAGRKLHDEIEGFREFLLMTEKDRLNFLNPPEKTPGLFSSYLPYALALDVEQNWAEEFSSLLGGSAPADPGSSDAWGQGNVLNIIGRLLKSP